MSRPFHFRTALFDTAFPVHAAAEEKEHRKKIQVYGKCIQA
jgi:hypothetical protein